MDPSGSGRLIRSRYRLQRETLAEGHEQLQRTAQPNLAAQQCPDDVLLFPQKADPCLRIGRDMQVRAADVSFLDRDSLVTNHDGCLALFVTGKSKMVRGVQPG